MASVSAARAKVALEVRDRRGPLSVLEIDNDRLLLRQSYYLRYQVYCLERKFLPAADYPDGMEVDKFDKNSVHLGVLNANGDLVGTARLVHPTSAGLPMFPRCSLYPDVPTLDFKRTYIVETGRLAVSRRADAPERRMGNDIILQIFKGGYQASKRHGFTHWVAAFENSLQRLMARYGFPWRPIGPQADYYGLVAPYLLSLDEFDGVIVGGRRPTLNTFLDGLEPQFKPVDVWKSVGAVR
jgi:N-acyl-L-homoserine lactone synthetase